MSYHCGYHEYPLDGADCSVCAGIAGGAAAGEEEAVAQAEMELPPYWQEGVVTEQGLGWNAEADIAEIKPSEEWRVEGAERRAREEESDPKARIFYGKLRDMRSTAKKQLAEIDRLLAGGLISPHSPDELRLRGEYVVLLAGDMEETGYARWS